MCRHSIRRLYGVFGLGFTHERIGFATGLKVFVFALANFIDNI